MVKIEQPSMPMQRGHLRPISSEPGAQISGPKANPRTKRLVPRAATTRPTEKVWRTWVSAAAKTALLKEVTKVARQAVVAMLSLSKDLVSGKVEKWKRFEVDGVLLPRGPVLWVQGVVWLREGYYVVFAVGTVFRMWYPTSHGNPVIMCCHVYLVPMIRNTRKEIVV